DNRPTREAPGPPRRDAAADPAASPGDTLGRRQDDPDDQPCLHDLAEDNNHTDEHKAVSRSANANHSQLDSSYTAHRGDASQSRTAASSCAGSTPRAPEQHRERRGTATCSPWPGSTGPPDSDFPMCELPMKSYPADHRGTRHLITVHRLEP